MTDHTKASAADTAFLEAIEMRIEERNAYPDGASFVDAEQAYAGRAIARATSEGRAVVLCSADGSRQLLVPVAPRGRLTALAVVQGVRAAVAQPRDGCLDVGLHKAPMAAQLD